jgi:hypothetical protein
VAERIRRLHEQTGGFGRLIMVSYDATNERETWERSLRMLIEDVLPRCQGWEGQTKGGKETVA